VLPSDVWCQVCINIVVCSLAKEKFCRLWFNFFGLLRPRTFPYITITITNYSSFTFYNLKAPAAYPLNQAYCLHRKANAKVSQIYCIVGFLPTPPTPHPQRYPSMMNIAANTLLLTATLLQTNASEQNPDSRGNNHDPAAVCQQQSTSGKAQWYSNAEDTCTVRIEFESCLVPGTGTSKCWEHVCMDDHTVTCNTIVSELPTLTDNIFPQCCDALQFVAGFLQMITVSR